MLTWTSSYVQQVGFTSFQCLEYEHNPSYLVGYNTDFQMQFPILGRGGKSLDDAYKPHPRTYLSACTSGFPNFFFATGPNSGVGSGSLLVVIEKHVEYAVKAVQKMQRERLKSIEVKEEAVNDYEEFIDVSGRGAD